ncbi:MAG: hypothetical protein U0136_12050 [Bdellovibrionota bacterium]
MARARARRFTPAEQALLRRFANTIHDDWDDWTDDEGTLVPLIKKIWPPAQQVPYFVHIDDVVEFVDQNRGRFPHFPSRDELQSRLERETRGVAEKERQERLDKQIGSASNVVGIAFAVILLVAIGWLILTIMVNSGLPLNVGFP